MEDFHSFDMMEGLKILEESWGKLQLNEEEQLSIPMEKEEVSEMDNTKDRRSLVGKICSERNVSRDVIQSTMGKIWKLSKAVIFKEVERNMFIITFNTEADK